MRKLVFFQLLFEVFLCLKKAEYIHRSVCLPTCTDNLKERIHKYVVENLLKFTFGATKYFFCQFVAISGQYFLK